MKFVGVMWTRQADPGEAELADRLEALRNVVAASDAREAAARRRIPLTQFVLLFRRDVLEAAAHAQHVVDGVPIGELDAEVMVIVERLLPRRTAQQRPVR